MESKRGRKKEYKTAMGKTDYNIPMFGYRSSLIICLVSVLVILFVPEASRMIFKVQWPGCLISGVMIGYTIAFTQYFVERKLGFCKGFALIGAALSLFISLLLILVYYAGILI